jgi:pyruvate/2-oxoglutarate/acetoin dehydrogenase E1 component
MNYREEITRGWVDSMREDSNVLILGEGVTDPKGIFGTTLEATKLFPDRVIEIPISENMITGACLGLALEGWKPVLVHARCDFMMLAMEHMVNTAAKWRPIHGDKPFTMVIRALVGRGWGQGPNHSQAFHAMFAHVPGLRVLYPVHPNKVGYWMQEALTCGDPTIILEPRRLYEVDAIDYPMVVQPDVFLVTFGDVVLDAALAATQLAASGIKAQVFPIEDVTNMPLPETNAPTVIADTAHLFCGATAEVAARLAERGNTKIKRVGPPFMPLPTSVALEEQWYPDVKDIVQAVFDLLDIKSDMPLVANVGDRNFKGPF